MSIVPTERVGISGGNGGTIYPGQNWGNKGGGRTPNAVKQLFRDACGDPQLLAKELLNIAIGKTSSCPNCGEFINANKPQDKINAIDTYMRKCGWDPKDAAFQMAVQDAVYAEMAAIAESVKTRVFERDSWSPQEILDLLSRCGRDE